METSAHGKRLAVHTVKKKKTLTQNVSFIEKAESFAHYSQKPCFNLWSDIYSTWAPNHIWLLDSPKHFTVYNMHFNHDILRIHFPLPRNSESASDESHALTPSLHSTLPSQSPSCGMGNVHGHPSNMPPVPTAEEKTTTKKNNTLFSHLLPQT